MTRTWRRLQLIQWLQRWYLVIALGLVVLVVAGGVLAFNTHVDTGTEELQESEITLIESASIDHEAFVTRDTLVFDEGDSLTGPTYFSSLTPVFNAKYTYEIDRAQSANITVETTYVVDIRSTERDVILWQDQIPVGYETITIDDPDATATTQASVNVTQIESRINQIHSDLGTTAGSVDIRLIVNADVVGTVNGDSIDAGHDVILDIEPDSTTYFLEMDEPFERVHETTNSVTVPATYGTLRSYGSILLLVLGLLGIAGLGYMRSSDRLRVTSEELQSAEFNRDRAEFDDWISVAEVPVDGIVSGSYPIRIASLEDLVDIAIDTDNRVIQDPESGDFVVIDDQTVFVHSPPHMDGQVTDPQTTQSTNDSQEHREASTESSK